MAARGLRAILLALVFSHVSASAVPSPQTASCRYIPGDAGWPKQCEWAKLNGTVGGRLIATVPLAHVCHLNGPFAAYDKSACDELGQGFLQSAPATM